MHLMSHNLPVNAVMCDLDGMLLFGSTDIGNTHSRALIENQTICQNSVGHRDRTGPAAMLNVLRHWIYIGSNAYDEYTFIPWLNKNVYRRTVDLSLICIQ